MDLQDESLGERKGADQVVGQLGRLKIALHFQDVLGGPGFVELGLEHVREGCLRALDSGAGQRLAAQVRADQQARVGDERPQPMELAEGSIRLGEGCDDLRPELDVARNLSREVIGEGPCGPGLAEGSAEGAVGEVLRTHAAHPTTKIPVYLDRGAPFASSVGPSVAWFAGCLARAQERVQTAA